MMINQKETCAKCMDGEIEPRHCEYYGEPNGCNSPTYGEHPPVGNTAQMREALILCSRIIGANGIRGNVFLDDIQEAHKAITDALVAPPRNCDVVKTCKDAKYMFLQIAELPEGNGDADMREWYRKLIAWLFAPAEERKGEGK